MRIEILITEKRPLAGLDVIDGVPDHASGPEGRAPQQYGAANPRSWKNHFS